MKISIDSYLCSGCAACIELCPTVFIFGEHSEKAELVLEDPPESEELQQAIAYCPEKCIEVDGY